MPKSKGRMIEDEVIEQLQATPHANSGAMKKKHDGSDEVFLYEVKTTDKSQYTFKFDYFYEVQRQAFKRRLLPAMVVVSTMGENKLDNCNAFVTIRFEDFLEMMDVYMEAIDGD